MLISIRNKAVLYYSMSFTEFSRLIVTIKYSICVVSCCNLNKWRNEQHRKKLAIVLVVMVVSMPI